MENSDPLATSVSFDTLEVAEPALLVEFENVPSGRLSEISGKMDTILKKIVSEGVEHFDLERIHNLSLCHLLNINRNISKQTV